MRYETVKRLFGLIVAVMAVIACNDKDSRQDWSGMEYYTFTISGKVTDASGSPIRGITVDVQGDRTETLSDGTYVLQGRVDGTSPSVYVNFTDFDGEENGGHYLGNVLSVTLNYVKGAHGPYLGLYEASGVDVQLLSGVSGVPPTDQIVPLP